MHSQSSSSPPSPDGKNIIEWDEAEVQDWLTKLGFPQYESQIREHNISGEVLTILDAESLKELGVSTIGQRLTILKAVYQQKIAWNIPLEPDAYIPPSEGERHETVTVDKLHVLVKEQADRLRALEVDNQRLSTSLRSAMEDISSIRDTQTRSAEDTPVLRRQPSFKWAQHKPTKSPTKAETAMMPSSESPNPSPLRAEYDLPQIYQPPTSAIPPVTASFAGNSDPPKTASRPDDNNLKSFKVSLEDPAWKVLPAALKKYRINNDDWQNYAMFICYGNTERCLSYDEKPLLLFQKLKDAKKNPVFMLKHIKDIRSPIAVAQQKHAQRKASDSSTKGERTNSRPARLRTHGLSVGGAPPATATSAQPGWPEVMSPSVEKAAPLGTLGGLTEDASSSDARPTFEEAPVAQSYAVAIYPYMAEQDDEFDVVVGDTFIIISRAPGWWVVQRDPSGSGIVDPDTSKHGWVPAGCLLETSVPVASAVAEATANGHATSKQPILPLSIISTSFPGIALMDYRKKGDEELDLSKDDQLRVFKKYNHWSYAVKEEGGDRGWVPSWFIGKVQANPPPPSTPTTTITNTNATLDSDFTSATGAMVSPMSSAFPQQLMPARTATTVT